MGFDINEIHPETMTAEMLLFADDVFLLASSVCDPQSSLDCGQFNFCIDGLILKGGNTGAWG